MIPEIKEKKGFTVIGLRYFGNNANNEIPELWGQFLQHWDEVKNVAHPHHSYKVCTSPEAGGDTNASEGEFEYVAGREVTGTDAIPEGMVAREVPGGKYAVFTHRGSLANLQETYRYIYGEWAQKGEYKPTGATDYEFYNEKFDPAGSEGSELYIYIPIV